MSLSPLPEKDPHRDLPATPMDPRQLRLAIFSDSLPERNGAGAYYQDLAVQLRPEIGGLELFQPIGKHPLLKYALPLPGDSTQKLITPNIPRLWKQFKSFQPHLVVSVTPGPFGLLGLYLARSSQTGFITAFHTHFEGLLQLYGDTLFFRVAVWYLKQINRILCSRSATVLVNNDGLMTTVRDLGAPRTDLMGTPLSPHFLDPPMVPPRHALRRVLFAGRLAPEKNLSAITEAVEALPDLEFVMAGDGPLRRKMEAVAARCPNLRLTGWLGREALRKEMDDADLLLLPSHLETFGTVALEALSRGRPALVAEAAGIHQWTLLKGALYVLHNGESVATRLQELRLLPREELTEKAIAARTAAETLNEQTIDEWVGFVCQFARP